MDSIDIMEDGGVVFFFVKVTNANIMKVAIKSPCVVSFVYQDSTSKKHPGKAE